MREELVSIYNGIIYHEVVMPRVLLRLILATELTAGRGPDSGVGWTSLQTKQPSRATLPTTFQLQPL